MSSWYGHIKDSMPVPQEFTVTVRVVVCPDNSFFPSGRREKHFAGCAIPGKLWIKGYLADGKVLPEDMAVLGHEFWHTIAYANAGAKDPD